MPRRRPKIPKGDQSSARRSNSLPSDGWQFVAWTCERWDRWRRVVLFAVALTGVLIAALLILGSRAPATVITAVITHLL